VAVKLTDSTTRIDLDKFLLEVEDWAMLHYGQDFRKHSGCISGVAAAFSRDLRAQWLSDRARHPRLGTSWSRFIDWIRAHIDREVRHEPEDHMHKLVFGDCKQNGTAVHRYFNRFRRHSDKVPSLTEEARIALFRAGLDPEIRNESYRTLFGTPFTTVESLVEHLAVQEIRKRGLGQAAAKKRKYEPKSYRKNKRSVSTLKAAPDHNADPQVKLPTGPQPAQVAVAESLNPKGGGSGRGFGRGSGRSDGGRGRGSGRGSGRGPAKAPGNPEWWDQPDIKKAFGGNMMISLEQAQWLRQNGRCFRCTKPRGECTRKPDMQCVTQSVHNIPGCPVWRSG